jgi:hypothetical protein
MALIDNSFRRVVCLAAGLLISSLGVGASANDEIDAIIGKARAYVGSEEALNSVTSIHYVGQLISEDGTTGKVDIIFQKPNFQMVVVEIGNIRETTALSGYEGWRKVEDLENETDWELTLLEARQIRRLQANVWENLNWFRGIQKRNAEVVYDGRKEIDGVDCHKVSYLHGDGIQFIRYFDIETGRLVVTETEQGGQIREEGQILEADIRFPESVVTSVGDESSKIQFDRVEVNRKYDEEMFDVPMLLPSSGS